MSETPTVPRMGKRVDVLLMVLTVAFAFLAASFAAANSDLWMHLASGRLIANGAYYFGVDPFSYTTEQVYWANHSWLFDIGLYSLYQADSGLLVVLKALGIAALAAIMLRIALRAGGPIWLGAGCTLLAILAMSPRLLLQPQCLSSVLLGLCLHLLLVRGRAFKFVPVLIALWVNLDAWFLLGPLLVVLFLLGERLNRSGRTMPRWLLPASFFACLLSPHHVYALTLPPELSPSVWSSGFADDPRFAGFFASPWRLNSFGPNLAAWAFPMLLFGGLVSFAINRSALRSWRSLVWLAFAILASWQARLVPFFAVVAGPILAMNLGEAIGAVGFLRAGRIATMFSATTLLVLTWPGWLQSFSSRDRALAWQIAPDPSLVHAAQTVRDWRERGSLFGDYRVFTTHQDAAHYFAWLAPGEKTFLDSRLQLFTSVAHDNREVARFIGLASDGERTDLGQRVLQDRKVLAVVLYEPDRQLFDAALRTAHEYPERGDLAQVAGSVVLFRYRHAMSIPRFDAERLAFGPLSAFSVAPSAGPDRFPEPAEWWDLAAHRRSGRSWEADAAPVLLRMFELQSGERSPALPLLAVRAARTGIAIHPLGDDAWLALARAYWVLGRGSWEATAGADLTMLRYLRHVQVVSALQFVAMRNPDSSMAHELLAGAFGERRVFDLALQHRREQMRLLKRTPLASETLEARGERIERLQQIIDELERTVQDGENRFLVHTFSLSGNPLERAQLARDLGLGGKAIDVLVRSHPDLYGVDGIRLLLDLLLQAGRLNEARILLDREELVRNPGALDLYRLPGGTKDGKPWRYALPAYDWFDFCESAAAGRYDRADLALERLRERMEGVESMAAPQVMAQHLRTALFELGSAAMPAALFARVPGVDQREAWAVRTGETRFLSTIRADLHVLGGLLKLERGAIPSAEGEFNRALALYERYVSASSVYPGRPLSLRYREALLLNAKPLRGVR